MPIDRSEEIVNSMLAEGSRILTEVMEKYDPIAVVAAFSGGDDSIVATHFAMTTIPECTVFNADTLIGMEPTRKHIRAMSDRFDWPLEIGRAEAEGPPKKMRKAGKLVTFDQAILPSGRWTDGATAFEETSLNWGFFGRGKPQHARMYQRLKERPFRRMLKKLGASKAGRKALIISGVRHDESAIRAGYKRSHAEGYFGDVWVNPFYFRTAGDFAIYRDEFGLPGNPVKRLCGISGECCCGTFAGDGERQSYAIADPDFDRYLTDLETRVRANGFPWGWGESPPRWWKDQRRGQAFLDFEGAPAFQPMCVGCVNGRR